MCNIADNLATAFTQLEVINNKKRPEAEVARSNSQEIEINLYQVKNEYERKQNYKKELENYTNNFEFFYLKSKCFDAIDGKFTYSLCFLENIHQKETDGGNRVSLGNFKSLDELDDGTFEMKFDSGQYCHAFGPRTASVKISCGSENKLTEAAEPSTCFYTFKFSTPAACSVKFGNLNNLL